MALLIPRHELDLADALADGSGPLYRRLAAALEAAIVAGEHPVGSRLPPERKLAADLGLARVTVVAAYDLLRDAGLVERREGSGTRVAARPPGADPWVGAGLGQVLLANPPIPGEYLAERREDITFSIAALPGAEAITARAARFVMEELPGLVAGYGYEPAGLPSLREAIARRYAAHGMPTHAEQIVVTAGAQQAIDLLVRLLVGPGTVAVVDEPTYPGALDALRAVGARIVGVPTDTSGMRADLLEAAVSRWHPRLVYLVATHHNPTGVSMPAARRREILEIVERAGVPLVDDATLTGLNLDERPEPPPFAALPGGERIITLGSLSKLAWGGLRIGWIRAPISLAQPVTRLKLAADHGGSLVGQGIAAGLLDELDVIAEQRRQMAADRCRTLLGALEQQLPEWRWTRPSGGLSVWARIPRGTASSLAEIAAEQRVVIVPGPAFSASGGSRDRVRLPFGAPPEDIREGIRRLARAWEDYRPMATAERPPVRLVV